MIDYRNFVRVPSKARLWDGMGPGALRRNGALFRGQRNFWDVADDISAKELLGLRCSVAADVRQRCSERRSALACRAVMGVLTLVKPGSSLLVRRSHGYPDFLPPVGTGRRLRRLGAACS